MCIELFNARFTGVNARLYTYPYEYSMKLSKKAIKTILSNRNIILAIGIALNFGERWITILLNANKENGPLTTAAALEVIRKETGLGDQEILVRVATNVS